VLVAALVPFLIPSSRVEIKTFSATPATGAPAGEPILLSWDISGKPSAVFIAEGSSDLTPLDESLWRKGPYSVTALTPGPLKMRLTAIEDGAGEDDSPLEISRSLDLAITEGVQAFTAPAVTSFAVTPLSAVAGQPLRFDWTTTGDVLMVTIDFGSGAPPTVTDPERLAAGSLELPLLAGDYRAVATAVGKDNSRVESEGVAFVVRPSQPLPKVTLSAKASGRRHLTSPGKPAADLTVQWDVVGEHTGLQVSYLRLGASPSVHDVTPASGSRKFISAFAPEGSVVQLFVGQKSGPRLVYECQVGLARTKVGPERFEALEVQLDLRELSGKRVIPAAHRKALLRTEGG
jgi:hypothetical protein